MLFLVTAPRGHNAPQRDLLWSSAIKAGPEMESRQATPLTHVQAREAYGQIAMSFEANRGQTDASVNFLARGAGYTLFLKPTEAVFVLARQNDKRAVLRMKLVGSDAGARAEGLDELAGKVNYFVGSDSSRWLTEAQTFGRVRYGRVYTGIDLVYYGNQRQLEYDFRVAPGVNAQAVKLEFEGADKVELNAAGELLLTLGEATMRQPKPVLYQEVAGVRRAVDGGYVIGNDGRVGFRVGEYDAQQTLVIDPVLSYSTYLGGSDTDDGNDIALDSAGNAYICGNTASTNFPTANAIQSTFGGANFVGGRDGFVTKLNAAGTAFVYSTYLGGSGDDRCNKISVDSSGNAYVAGETTSSNFPTANAFQATFGGGLSDAFVTKINAAGSALVYSTYLGGSIFDAAHAMTIDSSGNAYITGRTTSSNFPVVNPIQGTYSGGPGADAFVTKLNAAGTALVYSTYLGGAGGNGFTAGFSIKVDSTGNAYVTGQTRATDFPTANAIQATFGGGFPDGDAFITKINAAGSALVYSTYLGGSDNDIGFEIAVDSVGSAHIAGVTHSANFPTANAFQSTFKGASDAFVTKLSAAGTAFTYSTYLGGTTDESGNGIALDSAGNAYVAGGTTSTDFPTVNPTQATNGGGIDVFLTKFNPGGTSLIYSTYFGGSGGDTALAVALDSANSMYLTGRAASTNFPTLNPVQSANGGGQDAFVTKISDPPPPVNSIVQFQQTTYDVTEDITFVTVKVTRTGDTSTAANVDYATSDGTALQRTDYTIALGTLRFAPGETEKTLNLLVNEDSYVEGLETFTIALSNPTGNASLGAIPSATVRITDDATEPSTNVIDDPQIFVGQHYHDFLNRQADAGGLAYWTNEITKCGSDQVCINRRRIGVSGAFFIEMEFQDRGSVIHYLYRAGLGRRPMYLEFSRDRSFLPAGGNLAVDLQTLATDFVQRAEFTGKYAPGLLRDQFVDALLQNVQQTSGLDLTSRRSELLAEYDAGGNQTQSRARVLLKLIGYAEYKEVEYNGAFVLSQYFGYLRRDPDEGGYLFWLNVLNNKVPDNYRALVCAFITSAEYQSRFSTVLTHSNSECKGQP
ncbi:MAG TPA: SBBP repeat-containing protein [Pyrinomonadaceae bacterium]